MIKVWKFSNTQATKIYMYLIDFRYQSNLYASLYTIISNGLIQLQNIYKQRADTQHTNTNPKLSYSMACAVFALVSPQLICFILFFPEPHTVLSIYTFYSFTQLECQIISAIRLCYSAKKFVLFCACACTVLVDACWF